MTTKGRIMAVVVSVLCISAFTVGCGKVSIGYVDQERIQSEAPQIKSSIEEMQSKLAEVQQEAETEFQQAVEGGASQEDMQQLQQKMQMKAATIQQQYSIQIKAKVDAALDDIVAAKKLDTVLDSNDKNGAVISGGTDITEELIQKLQ